MRGRHINMQRCLTVFDFIIEYKQAHDGNSPSIGAIAEHISASVSQARLMCRYLARDGMIRLGKGHCSIEVIGGQWHLEDPFTP